jgi:hypothetical protein
LLARGAELVGEVESYEVNYRLYYPEGTIIELAEQIGLKAQAAAEETTQRPRLHRQQIVEPYRTERTQPAAIARKDHIRENGSATLRPVADTAATSCVHLCMESRRSAATTAPTLLQHTEAHSYARPLLIRRNRSSECI